jgi:phosphatidylglycerophosphate synthase
LSLEEDIIQIFMGPSEKGKLWTLSQLFCVLIIFVLMLGTL